MSSTSSVTASAPEAATPAGARYFLGIDGGGSKCRAVLIDASGQPLGSGASGPANPFQNFEQAIGSITEAALLAVQSAGLNRSVLDRTSACLGLAGISLSTVRVAMSAWPHPFSRMQLVTDLQIASLGAHNGGDGAVIIAGTGSCGYLQHGSVQRSLGGRGFPAGDQGSGAWIGLQAMQHVLLALDGFAETSSLVSRIQQHLHANAPDELVEKLGQGASRFATLAPLVFDEANRRDPVAVRIIQSAADYLNALARTLLASTPPRLCLLGGLAPLLTPWLAADVRDQLSPALASAELGAALLARRSEQMGVAP